MKQRLIFAATTCAALVLAGCERKPGRIIPELLPAVAVRAQIVESKTRVATEEVVGTVRAKLRSVIEAKVSGKIDQMLVVPGQKVKRVNCSPAWKPARCSHG